ncbi:MAG: hypothetical protein F6J89_06540 [Symploca sp. SIO1C4]|uniref:Uncharacterized protein n=1 Tax=Symploca sp. SIO1C4 TaxID=2607765 RepID=A0A6B3NCD0_9CYAN|nr:hypothetical protein [Symploca sp. SIO1C4]
MTGSPLQKFVLTPIVLSASVFAVLTLPLALHGSKEINLQMEKEQVFHGRLRDVATPYLGLAAAISFGAGVTSVAVAGWRESSHKSAQVEGQVSTLKHELEEKEDLLEKLKLSESKLAASGLKEFLSEEAIPEQPLNSTSANLDAKTLLEPPILRDQAVEDHPVAAYPSASVPTYLNSSHPKDSPVKPVLKSSTMATSTTPSGVEELHSQMQQLMAQMNYLQKAMQAMPTVANSEPQSQQFVKSWSVYESIGGQSEMETPWQETDWKSQETITQIPKSQGTSASWSQQKPRALRARALRTSYSLADNNPKSA